MLNDFNSVFQYSLSIGEVIENIVVALLCGIIISLFYKQTYKGPGLLNSFVSSLVLLSMITSIVIMIIGNNLARAFGLVGAMSIIRFRTAVKETQDIIYIFFALSIGMAAGVGLHGLAIMGAIAVGLVSYILSRFSYTTSKKDFLLQFTYETNGEAIEDVYLPVLKGFTKRNKLINAKSLGNGNLMEYSYHVRFRDKSQGLRLIEELKATHGINHVNLYFDEEYF